MIDFRLCDLRGQAIADLTELTGGAQGSVTIALNNGRSASVALSFDDQAGALVRPLTTVVKARWDQGPLFTGAVVRPQYSSQDRRITLSCRDPSLRLQSFQVGARSDGAGIPSANNGPWGWTGVDQSEMLARLMEHASPTAAETTAGVPGHGLARGVLPATRTRDRLYEPGKQVWEAMLQLSSVIDSVDFDLRPVDQTDTVYAKLDTYYPMMGADRSDRVVFEYGWGSNNCTVCNVEPGGDLVRNRSIHVGQIDEVSQAQPTSGVRDRVESRNEVGIYSEYVGESDVVAVQTLQESADATVTSYGFPPYFVELTPAQDDGSGYIVSTAGITSLPDKFGVPPLLGPQGDYWLGDVVRVIIRDGPAYQFDLLVRVVEITLSNAPSGAVVAQLKLAPVRGGGYRVPGIRPPSFVQEFISMRESLRLAGVVQ